MRRRRQSLPERALQANVRSWGHCLRGRGRLSPLAVRTAASNRLALPRGVDGGDVGHDVDGAELGVDARRDDRRGLVRLVLRDADDGEAVGSELEDPRVHRKLRPLADVKDGDAAVRASDEQQVPGRQRFRSRHVEHVACRRRQPRNACVRPFAAGARIPNGAHRPLRDGQQLLVWGHRREPRGDGGRRSVSAPHASDALAGRDVEDARLLCRFLRHDQLLAVSAHPRNVDRARARSQPREQIGVPADRTECLVILRMCPRRDALPCEAPCGSLAGVVAAVRRPQREGVAFSGSRNAGKAAAGH
mmetsp:Transcript_11042/g.34155  ORF Transcript_11042/g.34155 Transcript_11042/m.34155 type:complete len:304 (-) Transcript_11042:395-1306(-)